MYRQITLILLLFCLPPTTSWGAPSSTAAQLLVLSEPIVIPSHKTLIIKDTVILNLAQHPFVLADDSCTLILENCSIVLEDDYFWEQGKFLIKGICHILGPHIWHQKIPHACIVTHNGTLVLGNELTFHYQPLTKDQAGIILIDHSSTLILDNSHLQSGSHGLSITSGNVAILGNCTFHAENNTPQYGIIFGSGKSAKENVNLKLLDDSAHIIVTSPYFQEKKRTPTLRKILKFFGNATIAFLLCGGVAAGTARLLHD